MSKNSSQTAWASYLQWMLVTAGLLIAFTGAINIAVDPLGVFPVPRVVGFNAKKPFLDHHRELTRYRGALRACPDTGIFGNSRAGIGLDPASKEFASQSLTAYNHAVPGTGGRTTYQQILWLEAAHCLPRQALLGVDFFDFLGGSPTRNLPTLADSPAPRRDAAFAAESVFSVAGLIDSVSTIWIQHARYPSLLTEQGFNPLLDYLPEIASSGHYALFRQRASENLRSWAKRPMQLRPEQGGPSDDETVLDASIDRLVAAGSTVHIVLYPYHAELRMLMDRVGMADMFSAWKRLVLASAERASSRGGKVTVWDFSGISNESMEAIPSRSDRQTHLNYYWEAGHFKKELGDKMLARVFGQSSTFGVRLESSMLDQWLAIDQDRVRQLLDAPSPLRDEVDDVFREMQEKKQQ